MTREILFRGKRVDKEEWVEGYYALWQMEHFIFPSSPMGRQRKVMPETVGQYTGRMTKDLTRVFEGDILLRSNGQKGKIIYNELYCFFDFVFLDKELNIPLYIVLSDSTVIGNIHDNPELLKS